jgi:hypothetical protein
LPGILVTKIALKPMDNEPGDYRGVHNYGWRETFTGHVFILPQITLTREPHDIAPDIFTLMNPNVDWKKAVETLLGWARCWRKKNRHEFLECDRQITLAARCSQASRESVPPIFAIRRSTLQNPISYLHSPRLIPSIHSPRFIGSKVTGLEHITDLEVVNLCPFAQVHKMSFFFLPCKKINWWRTLESWWLLLFPRFSEKTADELLD